MKPKWVLEELAHFFFPNCCVVCKNKLLPTERGVCLQCLYKLPKTDNFKEPDNYGEILLAGRFPFERFASFCVFTQDGLLQSLIHEFKYNHKPYIAELLGVIYGKDLLGSEFLRTIDVIVPVPLHPKKKLNRGYNQAEAFANGLSKATSVKVSVDELIRVIDNPTQTKLTQTQRWENVEGIFDVRNNRVFENKHVLLVDDVITTGSTLEACAYALLKCENVKISIATVGEKF
ncbi:MAG: ComF family protein [Dysgonamonadaceae bacterium]|jgi:ComF family protein|nr:ComF family protein [Dysgonamonadaceae bacterium]MDD3355638.1 ComF family protein [Dysgonamonadaceae bacterium]MDD4245924.1 ComF family protein [Dysgonamonadaceae bacterium]MDD4605418.1 ComF family protein [Dysgonamonadaceae bacterium]